MDALPSRSRLQLLWLAGAAGLLLVLLVAGGALGWRGLRTAPVDPAATLSGDPASAIPVTSAAFELVDGVPWGFDLTVEGAASAAAAAVSVTGAGAVVFDPDRFAEVAEVVFTPTEAAEQARQVDAALVQFELSGWADQPEVRRTYHLAPLAVRVTRFDREQARAEAEVWAMTTVGVGDRGGAVFTTSTVSLLVDDDSWRVDGLDTTAGPTPIVEDRPDSPGRIRQLTRDALPTVLLPYGPRS
jgi:hypothetical protein